jgi:predicted metal-dependent peptidase
MSAPKWKDLEAYQKIMSARVLLGEERRPYVSAAVYSTILVEEPRCPSMAIDRYMRVYCNPRKLHAWEIPTIVTVLYHEIWHHLREHLYRWELMGVTEHTRIIANHAADIEINDDIEAEISERHDLAPLPNGAIYPRTYSFPAHEAMESYYHRIMSNQQLAQKIREQHAARMLVLGAGGSAKTRSKDGEWDVDCGSGAVAMPSPWELGAPDKSDVEGLESAEIFDVRLRVAGAVRDAQRSKPGSVPGHWVQWSDEILAPAPVRWEDELGETMRRTLHEISGFLYHTYSRPSRRASAVGDVVLPAWRRPRPEITIVEDTSGSMDDRDLALVRGTVDSICQSQGAQVTAIQCDTNVTKIERISTGRTIEFAGRGGTDMRVGIRAALLQRPRPDAVVCITDGETAWFENQEEMDGVRLVIALVRPRETLQWEPPDWARVVVVCPDTGE